MAESPRCSTCPYWAKGSTGKENIEYCLRFPPVLVYDGKALIQTSPRTEADEWCGEHPESLSRIRAEKAAEVIKATQNIRR